MNGKKLAIVIELNDAIKSEATKVCTELSKKLDINYIFKRTPCLHIMIESDLSYDNIDEIIKVMKNISSITTPFFIDSNGIGVFITSTPVIYLRWKKNNAILKMKESLLQTLPNHHEDINWVMKSTLAFHDTSYNTLNNCLNILEKYDFHQKLHVKSIHLYEYSLHEDEKCIQTFNLSS